jgi:hypothetical protein
MHQQDTERNKPCKQSRIMGGWGPEALDAENFFQKKVIDFLGAITGGTLLLLISNFSFGGAGPEALTLVGLHFNPALPARSIRTYAVGMYLRCVFAFFCLKTAVQPNICLVCPYSRKSVGAQQNRIISPDVMS